ncbi:hypothetical protein GCM10007276_12160 [Agaricicola taiwanensis]|uniref:Uncharacterized protein n=1 Tax=Agaricicola taiwanensis TaxID=591372 RepID=A0A8J2VRE7_9RHOB|nr:hypothetical protein [Agaricicola taiwanensis]GGE36244.1 hypothetical protein GCM10007276_12160 [Agaricicola taiwanensis]
MTIQRYQRKRVEVEADIHALLTEVQSALAMVISPDAIKNTTSLQAFAQLTEVEKKVRDFLATYEPVERGEGELDVLSILKLARVDQLDLTHEAKKFRDRAKKTDGVWNMRNYRYERCAERLALTEKAIAELMSRKGSPHA